MKNLFFICLALAVLVETTTAYTFCAVGRACWGKSFKLWSPNGSLCCANQRLYPTKRRVGCICVSKSEWCKDNEPKPRHLRFYRGS
ncbi:hypothetical protein RRG08_065253 [Elysia crispata]|uniref:Uncharacterized protein n=1 Tax=Elysia crispata TaxID=231223 RepID=A0AAE0XWB7_9GAST|nr:hypothetical protein RRG08_065253 [Elysia crispata]